MGKLLAVPLDKVFRSRQRGLGDVPRVETSDCRHQGAAGAASRRRIGRERIRRTHAVAGLGTTLILLAAPAARQDDPHVGLVPHDSCWIIQRPAEPEPD